ncbi:hypothetical protein N7490_005187 [Penicillium lividum]|nr:hypothetical protein N7490_005187 [Penicillium lividum]
MATVKVLETPDLYAIAWIAALPIERAAATAMLDERHDKPNGFIQHQADTNSYTWGRVGEHNVVIASLPAGLYGTTSAATTASNLLSSLPQIRIGLLVGIGGGIARPEQGRDIRLGDIVVGQPQGTTGGVIQHDLGKAITNRKWERKDFLGLPPRVLLQALASLQAEHEMGESRVPEFLRAIPRKKIGAPNGSKRQNDYFHQGFENDRLFRSSYNHIAGHDCRSCDATEEIERDERDSTDPEIHYGIIASGNKLIKDAVARDKIVEDVGEECICLEMEAAGLMNHFPCLVIRGICDYADSHKNDRWQRYASATAAAYGKELLGYVPTRDLQETRKALDVLKFNLKSIQTVASDTRLKVTSLKLDSHVKNVKKWLSPSDTSTNLNEALKKRQDGTGVWFVESETFQEWIVGKRQHLWLHGIPGCGKTVLTASIIEHITQRLESTSVLLDYFFDFSDSDKQTIDQLMRSLVIQLYSKCETSRKELDDLFISCEDGQRQPTSEAIFATFLQMVSHVQKIQIVIDALDECKTKQDLLLWLESFSRSGHAGLHLLITSRTEQDIESEITRWLNQRSIVSILQGPVNTDIRVYVHERLRNDRGFERWHSRPIVQDEIETELMKKAGGMFRWAACQLDTLQTCLDLQMLRKSLKHLPATLEETYARILASINENYRPYAIKILQFLTYSERPLAIKEALDIVVIDPYGNPLFDPALRLPEPREIMRVCSSLVSPITRWNYQNGTEELVQLQLAHLSVQQYLKSARVQAAFPQEGSNVGLIFQNSLNEISARESITRLCLAYLKHIGEQRAIESFEEAEELVDQFPFADYSARYWMDHAQLVETGMNIQEDILDFFLRQRKGYAVWLELLDQTGDFYETPSQVEGMANRVHFASLGGLQQIVRLIIEEGTGINGQSDIYDSALRAASGRGHKGIVQLLLEKGADVNAKGGMYGDSLRAATERGHKEIVQLLLENGADVNAKGGMYGDSLRVASGRGHKEIVQLLLEKGADVNGKGGIFDNALYVASSEGDEEIVQLLLEKGANPNAQGGMLGTALLAGTTGGFKGIVQLLLEKGADVNTKGGTYSDALYVASNLGYTDIVQLLLEKGANINAQDGKADNALYLASFRGYQEIVMLLLDKGADANAKGGEYGNALQAASHGGYEGIVRLLLEKGADVNMQGGKYGNALQAASQGSHKDIVLLLLEEGADVNMQGGKYGNALQAASQGGHKDIVLLLLEEGADVNNANSGLYGNALQAASQGRHKNIVMLLLEKGADVNAKGDTYRDALCVASNLGYTDIVQLLLEKGAETNAKSAVYGDALQTASHGGYEGIVMLLLEKGADVNAKGGEYGNALQAASHSGYEGIVMLLLEKGADVNVQGGKYGNALQAASRGGHKNIVMLLLEKGADVNAKSGVYGNAIYAALQGGHMEIMQLLLEQGVDVLAKAGYCENALYTAAERGQIEIMRFLLENGTDINAQVGQYGNALQVASQAGHKKVVVLLLESSVDVNAQGGGYGNALQAACQGGYREIVELLLEKGANVNAQGGWYGNALQAACQGGHREIVELLLEKGANVNAQSGKYNNALQAASQGGHGKIVQLLLERGADVNAQGGFWDNALYVASELGHKRIVRLLLEKGADVNAQGGEYGNALQAASWGRHTKIVEMLLEKGANVNEQGGRYGNALQAASEGGYEEIVQLLLEKGAETNTKGGEYGNALLAALQGRHKRICG